MTIIYHYIIRVSLSQGPTDALTDNKIWALYIFNDKDKDVKSVPDSCVTLRFWIIV